METDLKVATDCVSLTSEQRISKAKLLRTEALRIENYEVDRLMGFNGVVNNEVSDGEQFANLACDDANNCGLCSTLYCGHVIANRKDLSDPYIFTEWLRCYTIRQVQGGSRTKATGGVYGIICTKHDCRKRGIVYVGSAEKILSRMTTHKHAIITISSKSKAVHRHFLNHGQGVELPPDERLQHFSCVILEEVSPEQRLDREQYFMDKFGTLYSYGFNASRAINTEVEHEPELPSPTSAPRKRAKFPTPKAFDRTIPEKVLLALALKNHPNHTDINLHETATFEQITRFGSQYFNDNPFTKYMRQCFNKNINPSSYQTFLLNPATTYCSSSVLQRHNDPTLEKVTYTSLQGYRESDNWFRWANKSKFTEAQQPSRHDPYAYGFKLEEADVGHPDFNLRRPIHEQEINDEIEAEKDIISDMLINSSNLDAMLAGALPLAPVVSSSVLKRLS